MRSEIRGLGVPRWIYNATYCTKCTRKISCMTWGIDARARHMFSVYIFQCGRFKDSSAGRSPAMIKTRLSTSRDSGVCELLYEWRPDDDIERLIFQQLTSGAPFRKSNQVRTISYASRCQIASWNSAKQFTHFPNQRSEGKLAVHLK